MNDDADQTKASDRATDDTDRSTGSPIHRMTIEELGKVLDL